MALTFSRYKSQSGTLDGKTGIVSVSVLAGLWPPASLYRTFNDLVTLATHLSEDEQNATPTAPQSAMQLE